MKKRLIAMLLVASMLLSLNVPAFAAGTRQTDFFEDRTHADVNFVDMLPADVDSDDFLAKADAIRDLLGNSANSAKVTAAFEDLVTVFKRVQTATTLVYIHHAQNASDEALAEKLEQLSTDSAITKDGLSLLIRDILASECSDALDGYLSDEEKEVYSQYEGLTDRAIELQGEITKLVNQYYRTSEQAYTASLNGKSYTADAAMTAVNAGDLSVEDYTSIATDIQKQRNQALGSIYIELVPMYKEIAHEVGYDNYADYAYGYVFGRDYTPTELNGYREAVKQYIVPLIMPTNQLYASVANADVFSTDYSGDKALDVMAPYVDQLSSEMTEAFNYMRQHGLYDNGYDDAKMTAGFTTLLSEYNAPFFFNDASGSVSDLTTAIHEFGHYNRMYWGNNGWSGEEMSSYDSAEVHSQGLELLMAHYFPEMLGENNALALEAYQLFYFSYIVSLGSLFDELQLYAFEEDNLTLDKMNKKYNELAVAYGIVPDDSVEVYDWVEVPHSYENPFYYISYSTSAAGALSIWQESQKDYFKAVDSYLEFTSLDNSVGFQEGFEQVGLMSPISPDFIKSLAETLGKETSDLSKRIEENTPAVGNFTDVPRDAWYTNDVAGVYAAGIMSGMSDTSFAPNGSVNRAMAAAILYRMDESPEMSGNTGFTDVSADSWYNSAVLWGKENGVVAGYPDNTYKPAKGVTREELVALMYRYAQDLGVDTSDSENTNILSYSDAFSLNEYAVPAMQWACSEGIIQGADGKLMPQKGATRAELAAITMRFMNVLAEADDAA